MSGPHGSQLGLEETDLFVWLWAGGGRGDNEEKERSSTTGPAHLQVGCIAECPLVLK